MGSRENPQELIELSSFEVTAEHRQAVEHQLRPGEQILWLGRPLPDRHAQDANSHGASWFGRLWLALTLPLLLIGSLVDVAEGDLLVQGSIARALFGAAVAAAPGIIALRAPARARNQARRTVYAITDQRVLTVRRHTLLREVTVDSLHGCSLWADRNGLKTLVPRSIGIARPATSLDVLPVCCQPGIALVTT